MSPKMVENVANTGQQDEQDQTRKAKKFSIYIFGDPKVGKTTMKYCMLNPTFDISNVDIPTTVILLGKKNNIFHVDLLFYFSD